ncbi:uncharacterized protein EI97DRAFT_500171 [Westerdykella ornata]|uniref:lytic cellulose monooxygenase (C4-dehydrogenating) n=1 Tax=Westerdykella ornata TaxID=318751 RepID=A0A6A6JN48_WESOR|nr:uncharacterized protein EI97DRAFT_500171 [Westerdykella ornata]KAF2277947.1 hypothetical protein EI97DRAFT_500171 [Westerdykella ornata]
MKLSSPVAVLLLSSIHDTTAHYVFSRIALLNQPPSPPYTYVRPIYPPPDPQLNNSTSSPQYSVYSPHIRCGWFAHLSGSYVNWPLDINAGDTVSVSTTQSSSLGDGKDEEDMDIYHPGPATAYLSFVAEEPREDGEDTTALRLAEQKQRVNAGDGWWFKIGEVGAREDGRWVLNGREADGERVWSLNFTIPPSTPPGYYLLRTEHLYGYSSSFNSTQFYVSCAHLRIKGPGGGSPGPLVKFPGAYDAWDRSIWFPFGSTGYNGYYGLKEHSLPGPPVWKG